MSAPGGTAPALAADPAGPGGGGSKGANAVRGSAGRRRKKDAGPAAPPRPDGGRVDLLAAYALYALLGLLGAHHAYLGRPRQGLAWFATGGLLGFGLVRDLLRMPYYVALANDDRSRVAVRVRAATVEAREGVPRMSLARVVLMAFFGKYFGFLASCMLRFPSDDDLAYGLLRAAGAAAGVWIVGNMGEEAIRTTPAKGGDGLTRRGEFLRLAAWCLGGFALAKSPVLGGIAYAVRRRRYRPSMSPPATAGARMRRHLLRCAAFSALMFLAVYNHGSVIVNGHKVYLGDALRNALRSDFWQEFDWEKFKQESSSGGSNGGEYLKDAFDLGGERAARRTLGVPAGADHAEVRSAYKRLALKYHPDKLGADASEREAEEARAHFVRVQEAYEVLNNVERARKKRAEGATGGGGGDRGGGGGPRGDEM